MLWGPLATVSPSEKYLLVFGIGIDQMLHMAVLTAGTKTPWSLLLAVILGLQEKYKRLFVHASLDAIVWDEETVCVASIDEINQPCVYVLSLVGDKWVLKNGQAAH